MSGAAQESVFEQLSGYGCRRVHLCCDPSSGLRAVIAIHSTTLGPANGGLRMWPYRDEGEAIHDAVRLARGMTYKWAAAGEDRGGGKAVIIGDPRADKSEALLRSFGRFVDRLGGDYYTGEDVGTTLEDMAVIYRETDYVATLPKSVGGIGDISAATVHGVIHAMRACVKRVWGTTRLSGRSVALQGLGVCGSRALELLIEEGAHVIVSDVDEDKVERAREAYDVEAVSPDSIYAQDVDIFAPFALGGVINDGTVDQIRAKVIAGSANNILAEDRLGEVLEERGIVYAVDFIANAGGAIFDAHQFYKGGFVPERAWEAVDRIFDRTEEVFRLAERDRVSCVTAAKRMAEARLDAVAEVRAS